MIIIPSWFLTYPDIGGKTVVRDWFNQRLISRFVVKPDNACYAPVIKLFGVPVIYASSVNKKSAHDTVSSLRRFEIRSAVLKSPCIISCCQPSTSRTILCHVF